MYFKKGFTFKTIQGSFNTEFRAIGSDIELNIQCELCQDDVHYPPRSCDLTLELKDEIIREIN